MRINIVQDDALHFHTDTLRADFPRSGFSSHAAVSENWPHPFNQEHGKKARKLHDVVQTQDWIQETVAASGGIGAGQSSIWVFHLENYAALDTLLRNPQNEVCKAYSDFFSDIPVVTEKVREKVNFV